MSSKSFCRSSSSDEYPLDDAGTSRDSCSRFIAEDCRPSAADHAFARSGDIGSERLRPGIWPAVTRGSGGAQKMSNAASNVGRSSFRLTKTERSALRKSAARFSWMWVSARVASVRRRGPASRPASCSSLAKAARRGSRSDRTAGSSRTAGLLDQRGHLLAHPLQVLLVLQRRAERRVDKRGVDLRRAESGERARPVERLRDPRNLVQVHRPQALDERGDLAGQPVRGLRRAGAADLDLLLEVRVVDPVVEAAALQRVVNLARAVRRDDHERRLARLDGAQLGNRNLEVGEQLEEERLELFVGAVDLVDQQHRCDRVVVVDRSEQRSAKEELRREDLALRELAIRRLVEKADVEQLARVV